MKLIFRWKCPYCGHENKAVHNESELNALQIATCDSEQGGCDQQVVIRSHINIAWETYKFDGPATTGLQR